MYDLLIINVCILVLLLDIVQLGLEHLLSIQVTDWHHLGLKLGVPEDELRAIRLNNPVDLNACKREMLSRWLQRDIQAMYTKLEDALLECGDSETASDVAKQRGSGCQWKD